MINKLKITKVVEDTMACTAFAEVGEPCPTEEKVEEDPDRTAGRVEERIAPECALFHENGDQCFI